MSARNSLALRILLVDDEAFVCGSIKLALTLDGHAVKMTTDPEKAVALLATQTFDLILTDYTMPKISGAEVVRIAREKDINQRAIIMSGQADRLRAEGRLPRQIRLLTKPFTLDELREAINC